MEILNFGGIAPRQSEHTLPGTAARVAHDVKLRNGRLEAWREPKPLTQTSAESAMTVYCAGNVILSWDKCVTVAEPKPDSARLYITGRAATPEVVVLVNGIPSYSRLGVLRPASAPVVNFVAATITKASASRSYVYTYVNQFGEEGPPSFPSPSLTVVNGQLVTVSGFSTPPAEYGIVSIRLYRTETAFRDGYEKEQKAQTDYFLVAEVPADTAVIEDNRLSLNLGEVLTTVEVREPPAVLRKIRRIEASGTFVGIHHNRVLFSENHQGFNWPVKQEYSLDHNCVNCVVVNDRVFVSTDGAPYVIDGSIICEENKSRLIEMSDTRLPDISCGYENSAIGTPFGMVYSSMSGLVLVKNDASVEVITSPWFGEDDWRGLEPHTVRLAYWRGCLFCVTEKISFILFLDETTFQDSKIGRMVTLSDRPVDLHLTRNGELLLLQDDIVYQWDAGENLRPYEWISREVVFVGRASMTAAKVRTDDILFSLYPRNTDGPVWERKVVSDEPFRLPRSGRRVSWRLGFSGTGTVEYVKSNTSVQSVNRG